MRRLALGLILLASCSSSSSNSAVSGGDGGGDAAASNTMVCGGGSITGYGHAVDPMTLGPIAGATGTAPGCTPMVTDSRGYGTFKTDPSFLIKFDATANGYSKEHLEFYLLGQGATGQAFMWPSSFMATLPGWTSSDGYVVALVSGNGADTGTCASGAGATLSINGHSEIKATYFKDNVNLDPTLSATSSVGIGALGPIPPGTYEIDATKTGCTAAPLTNASFKFPTTTTVSAGVITLQILQLM